MDMEIPSDYLDAYRKVEQAIKSRNFCIIAIGGTVASGKSRLSRFLAWKLQLSLLETDLFLSHENTKGIVNYKYINEILENKKRHKQHIIVEGFSILPILNKFEDSEIFLVHLKRIKATKLSNDVDADRILDDPFWKENTVNRPISDLLDIDSDSELAERAGLIVQRFF